MLKYQTSILTGSLLRVNYYPIHLASLDRYSAVYDTNESGPMHSCWCPHTLEISWGRCMHVQNVHCFQQVSLFRDGPARCTDIRLGANTGGRFK
jgi:hypothetical protein